MGSDDVFAITSRGDDIWFGNYAGGLHHLAADGSITRYTHDEDDPDSLPSDTVWSLAFDSNGTLRSEEHTSELQSLMRISYAVFCLQKKTLPSGTQSKKDK